MLIHTHRSRTGHMLSGTYMQVRDPRLGALFAISVPSLLSFKSSLWLSAYPYTTCITIDLLIFKGGPCFPLN